MKGIYLASKKHRIPGYDIDYNDIEKYEGINKPGNMLEIDLEDYDYIIATPPCNYYSRANYRRETSQIAQQTKHLLPGILEKLKKINKPFIVENVCNSRLLPKTQFYEFNYGQHHYYTNIFMFKIDESFAEKQDKQHKSYGHRDDNKNVDTVIKMFLELVNNEI